jgi:hypothetical protein
VKTAQPRRRSKHPAAVFFAAGLTGLVLIFLWGQVQINFILLKNDGLIEDKRRVEREVDELRLQIHALQSSQRIAQAAAKRGLGAVKAGQIEELSVDAKGIRMENRSGEKASFADIIPIRILLHEGDAQKHRKPYAFTHRP